MPLKPHILTIWQLVLDYEHIYIKEVPALLTFCADGVWFIKKKVYKKRNCMSSHNHGLIIWLNTTSLVSTVDAVVSFMTSLYLFICKNILVVFTLSSS